MKKFFYCVIYALLCIHGAIASSEEKIKSRDVLVTELRPLVDKIWTPSGMPGENEKRQYKLIEYINENLLSIYKEINYIDSIILEMESSYKKEKGRANEWYFQMLNKKDGNNTLLRYCWRRDDLYLKILIDMAKKFDVANKNHKKYFIALADPEFFYLNKNQRKIIELGEELLGKSSNDDVFQALIQSWFPEATQIRKPVIGDIIKMPRSGEMSDSIVCATGDLRVAKRNQEGKINKWHEEWNLLMQNILDAKKQNELDACAQIMEQMTYLLVEIISFQPPKDDKIEEEISELFFDKIFVPVTAVDYDIISLMKGINFRNKSLEALESSKLNSDSVMKCWKLFAGLLYGYEDREIIIETRSYLLQYSGIKAKKIIMKYSD